ncbi:hypothetical protein KAU51_04620 [Candidatus Parcubacteria bacterium]|nr:hypothetical protein [Candidatus Parcubacteria bacterium]
MNKRLFVSFIMAFAIAGVVLVPVSVALGPMVSGIANTAGVVSLAELAAIAIAGIIIVVAMWIAKTYKKAEPFPINSVMYAIMIAAIFAKTARYPIIKSMVKTSPQNLKIWNSSPRNL